MTWSRASCRLRNRLMRDRKRMIYSTLTGEWALPSRCFLLILGLRSVDSWLCFLAVTSLPFCRNLGVVHFANWRKWWGGHRPCISQARFMVNRDVRRTSFLATFSKFFQLNAYSRKSIAHSLTCWTRVKRVMPGVKHFSFCSPP